MTWISIGAVAAIAFGRLVWAGDYARRWWKATDGTQRRARASARGAVRSTTAQLAAPGAGRGEAHKLLVAKEERRFELLLVGGAIALAAWTQLFVSSDNPPADVLTGTTLALLFLGAATLLTVPLLFRAEGRHLTLIGRESAVYLGLGAIAVSLLSAIVDIYGQSWRMVAAVATLAIVLRDAGDVIVHLGLQRKFAYRHASSLDPASARPAGLDVEPRRVGDERPVAPDLVVQGEQPVAEALDREAGHDPHHKA